MTALHNCTNSCMLVLFKRAINVLGGRWEPTFSSLFRSSLTWIQFQILTLILFLLLLAGEYYQILCRILIPFLILISTLSPWLIVWASNFYGDVCKAVKVKATVSKLLDYFRLITFACFFSSV